MSSQPHPSPHTTLTPAWYRGGSGKGGFQPPPAVPSDASGNVIAGGSSGGGRHHTTRERSGSAGGSSVGSGGGGGNPTYSALVMGDNGGDSHGGVEEQGGAGMGSPRHLKQKREGGGNSRSDALLGSSGGGRSGSGSFHRSSSGGERGWGSSAPGGGSSGSTGIKPGRSLADLAARATQSGLSRTRSGCHAYDRESSGGGEPYRGRPESLQQRSSSGGYHGESGSSQPQKPLKPVIRYTRERLLSLRPNPSPPGDEIPIHLKHLAGIVILASEPQDPVSFDEFDADEIWAQAKERPRGSIGSAPPIRPSSSGGAISSGLPPSINTPSSGSSAITRASLGSAVANTTNGGGRWQRGVALPPASEDPLGRGGKASEAETPDELWDDPLATSTSGAAPDFSQFGVPLLDDDDGGAPLVNSSSGSMFDLGKMSEAARKFEEELHGPQKVEGEDPPDDNPDNTHMTTVDPRRPLASLGTTIRSGSGEDVNVFEDFEAPPSPEETSDHTSSTDTPEEIPKTEDNAETNANESSDPSQPDSSTSTSSEPVQSEMTSSNLLMQMIGVVGSGESSAAGLTPWGNIGGDNAENDPTSTPASIACVKSTYVPSNPWDTPSTSMTDGMDLTTRLETAMSEQKARETRKQVEEDQRRQKEAEAEKQRLLQKQQEEEVQRQATIKAQQEAQQQHALRAQQQSQQAQQPQQQQQQQQQQQPSQVEMVLMERITAILENSWGRASLMQILTNLHQQDARVIPLLGSTDALHALIARHPQRIALAKDPTHGDLAMLIMTNAQFLQHQQNQQQEDLQRQRLVQQQQQAAARAAAEAEAQAKQQAALLAAQQEKLRQEEEVQKKKQDELQRQQKPVVTNAPWYYADPQGNIQGPFGGEEMRQWLDGGYFKGDLPISQNSQGPFRQLSSFFPDWSVAFQPTANNLFAEEQAKAEAAAAAAAAAAAKAAEEEAERKRAEAAAAAAEREREMERMEMEMQRAKSEAQAQAAANAEAQAKAAALAKAEADAAEKRRNEKEAAHAAAAAAAATSAAAAETTANHEVSSDQNASSVQLKMLLGLGSASSSQNQTSPSASTSPSKSNNHKEVSRARAKTPPKPKKSSKFRTTDNPVATASIPASVPAPAPIAPEPIPSISITTPAPSAPVPLAWGGAAKSVGRKKSMSEIQQEEARVSARRAKERAAQSMNSVTRSSSGGWANVAASGSTAWSANTVKPVSVGASVSSASSGVVTGAPVGASMQQVRAKQQAQVAAAQKQVSQQQRDSKKAVDDFGARMAPALESWCKEQLRKLTGSDDLTLVSFCMTLQDPDEIKQYLTAYLGSTPQVNTFAAEFVNRKGGGKGQTEEWESAGGSKKGRNRKKGSVSR
eukprot:CAMPEP_0195515358 /NCGR_PEP_ID=MMETSP0794_2-20130614/6448_1 /TAXON_ID=515487 /ORGANISM="Stephanopyxis turris, Strain CCMP 815" /LENGTH=1362 /DNA_ID=CAMNT_0040643761 /DNA_START=213 /DNA_END=4301 /DNA_ORIENTATION=-